MATLINGNGNLAIYAQQDADWYAALMGGQTVITAVGNQFAYELLDSNTIGVKDGVIITTEGRRIQLDANAIDSFDIPTGAQGTTNYYIIGYHLVTGDLSEQTCETFVQLMENGTDTIPEGSFRDGDDEVFISLYRVEQDDLTIGTITLLLPTVNSLQEQVDLINENLRANNQNFAAAYQNGKYGFTINGNFYEIGGGGMPDLDYRNYLHAFTSSAPSDLPTGATYGLSFTASKECYICGYVYSGPINICVLSIDDIQIATSVDVEYNGQRRCGCYISPLKINTGDVVSVSAEASMLHVFEEA